MLYMSLYIVSFNRSETGASLAGVVCVVAVDDVPGVAALTNVAYVVRVAVVIVISADAVVIGIRSFMSFSLLVDDKVIFTEVGAVFVASRLCC